MSASDIAWQPDAQIVARANATAFLRTLGVPDYEALLACADREPERFYRALIGAVGYRFYRPFERVLDESRGLAWPRWCVGGTTNVTLNALDRWRGTPTYDKPAIVWEGEDGRLHCGIWAAEPGKVAIDYTEWEFCHIIAGRAVLTNEAGRSWTVRAGDAFVIPPGFRAALD